jgi:hypothetical protein
VNVAGHYENANLAGVGDGADGLIAFGVENPDSDQSQSHGNDSAWQLGLEWLIGTSPKDGHVFKDGDPFTEQLKEHKEMLKLRQRVADSCSSGGGTDSNNLGGLAGIPKYFGDYSTLLTFGKTGNLAATFLGSYNYTYTATMASSGQVRLSVTVTNTSHGASAIRLPFVGYLPGYKAIIDPAINRVIDKVLGPDGPMHPTTQTIGWTELVRCAGR